jgi:hypothetical protein
VPYGALRNRREEENQGRKPGGKTKRVETEKETKLSRVKVQHLHRCHQNLEHYTRNITLKDRNFSEGCMKIFLLATNSLHL